MQGTSDGGGEGAQALLAAPGPRTREPCRPQPPALPTWRTPLPSACQGYCTGLKPVPYEPIPKLPAVCLRAKQVRVAGLGVQPEAGPWRMTAGSCRTVACACLPRHHHPLNPSPNPAFLAGPALRPRRLQARRRLHGLPPRLEAGAHQASLCGRLSVPAGAGRGRRLPPLPPGRRLRLVQGGGRVRPPFMTFHP